MSDLLTRLRAQRDVCSRRYDNLLIDISAAEPASLSDLFQRLNEAASICNQLCQLIEHQEQRQKMQGRAS